MCTDEGIVCEVQALYDARESDDEADESVEPQSTNVSVSTAVNYIVSLKELGCSRALGDKHMSTLNKMEGAVIRSALPKQACVTYLLFVCFPNRLVLFGLIFMVLLWAVHLLRTLRSDKQMPRDNRFVVSGLDCIHPLNGTSPLGKRSSFVWNRPPTTSVPISHVR